jgi:tetratricopeptide (TPR) repeat protein
MPSVFISYRRDDSGGHVGRLYDRLRAEPEFRNGGIFLDVASIASGDDYRERIRGAIGLSAVVLAVIGKQWLTIADAGGRRRLEDPNDLVREELACAIRDGVPMIPVLVGGARSPRAPDLPEPLQGLARRDTAELTDARFDADFRTLLADVRRFCAEQARAAPKAPVVTAESYVAVGLHCLSQKDLDDANACFRAALQADPQLAMAHVHLATALQFDAWEQIRGYNYGTAIERLQEAERALDQAFVQLKVDPAVVVQVGYVFKDFAQAYAKVDQPQRAAAALERARDHFELAAARDANNAGAWNGLGSVALANRAYEAAIGYCSKAIALEPDYPSALYDLALAHYGRFGEVSDASARLAALKGFRDAYGTLLEHQADPAGERLPQQALDTLEQIANWLAGQVQAMAGPAKAAEPERKSATPSAKTKPKSRPKRVARRKSPSR